jgi:hypothetical protein
MSKLLEEQSLGTSSFYWWLGQVVDDSTWRDNINPKLHEDPKDTKGWGYRYKVRIFGNQSKDKQTEVTDEELPMAEVLYPVTAGSGGGGSKQSPNIRQGNFVLGFYKDGLDAQQPIILGVLGNNDNTELEGKDPQDGFKARTSSAGLSGEVPVAAKDQHLKSQGSGKPIREGSSANIGSIADPMQAYAGNESTSLNVAEKEEDSETISIQIVMKTLMAVVNRVKSAQSSFFGASVASNAVLQSEVNKATQMIASFIKVIISKIRGAILKAKDEVLKNTIDLLMPNERPILNEVSNKASDTLACIINKIIDGLVALVESALKGFLQNSVSAPICAAEKMAGKVLSKALDSVSGALGDVMAPIEAVSNVASGLSGVGGDLAGTIAGILQFPFCDPKAEPPQIREWSPWGGINIQDPLSGSLSDIISNAGLGATGDCDVGPILAGVPSFVSFGGNPDKPAKFNPIIDKKTGSVIGLDVVDPGEGYKSTPKIGQTSTEGTEVIGGGSVIIPIVKNGKVDSVVVKESGSGYIPSSNGTTVTSSGTVFSGPNDTIVKHPAPGPVIPKGTELEQDYTLYEGGKVPNGTVIESGTEIITPIVVNTSSPSPQTFETGQVLTEDITVDYFNKIPTGTTIPAKTALPYPVEVPDVLDLPNQITDTLTVGTFTNILEPGDYSGLLDYGFNAYPPNTNLTLVEGDEVYMPLNTTSQVTDDLGNVVATLTGKGPKVPVLVGPGSSGGFTTPEPINDLIGLPLIAGSTGGIPVVIGGSALTTSGGTPVFIGGNGGEQIFAGSTGTETVLLDGNIVSSGGSGGSNIIFGGIDLVSASENLNTDSVGGTTIKVGGQNGQPITLGTFVSTGDEFSNGLGQYPTVLRIKDVLVLKQGINYNEGDQIKVFPNSGGASFEPIFDKFGRVTDVKVVDGGIGFTELPNVFIDSDAGINAKLLPVFEVIRVGEDIEDSITIPEGTPVVQVIDCVGQVT